jgi:hypothetical protein
MKLKDFRLSFIFLTFLCLLFSGLSTKVTATSIETQQIMTNNRVALTCHGSVQEDDNLITDWGGQGTVVRVDEHGTWILTARHVAKGAEHCIAIFSDYSEYIAVTNSNLLFQHSDMAYLIVPNLYWPTHAIIRPLPYMKILNVWGNVHVAFIYDEKGNVSAGFTFDDNIYRGIALAPVPEYIEDALLDHERHLVYTNTFSVPGSSGGGVYDDNGFLVGVDVRGHALNDHMTLIVDIFKTLEEDN